MSQIEYIKTKDGLILKLTRTDVECTFEFQEVNYSVSLLDRSSIVKVYEEGYHFTSSLKKDHKGNLFLYTYRETMRFGEEDDRTDETYCLVRDEQDANNLRTNGNPIWGRVPYIYVSESGFVSVHEYVKHIPQ